MPDSSENIAFCHSCGAPMDVSAVGPFTNVECPACGKHTRVKREFGPYTLVRRHAIGGMSMVFVAHDNTLDREVALKILSEEYSADERRIAAFEEEARITASFSHPNVVRVLRTGRAFGRFYIAMELVPGGHFEHQIRERGKVPELEMLPLAIEVAQGLKAAHAAGLIHRDVKPGNILLDAEGHAKLVDFGLALVTQGGKAQATEFWATPYYVPPETIEGHSEDFRSDIYALGATLYHALSGKPSCGEETMATDILREAKKRVVPLSTADPEISSETCRIVEKAMAYHPDERFTSYDELIAELAASFSDLKAGRFESTASAARRRADKKRRERNVVITGATVVITLAGAALWWLGLAQPDAAIVIPPQVVVEVPPSAPDSSADIGRSYREARAAVEAGNFENAAAGFRELLQNPEVHEPTRTWAGIEAVLVHFLAGSPADARAQCRETLEHLRSLPEGVPRVGGNLPEILDQLNDYPPLAAPDPRNGEAANVIGAMLAGLKNWEQGMLVPAAACFQAAVSAKLRPEDEWVAVYQKLAAAYLADHEVLSGPLFTGTPGDKAGCEAAARELENALPLLKTRGRSRFNVRAWQLDLTRRGKLLAATSPAADSESGSATVTLAEVLAGLAGFASDCRFEDAIAYLNSLAADPEGAARSSLLSVTESSSAFLTEIESDLAKQPVAAELPLKSGEIITRISISSGGVITATSADGRSRPGRWGDFQPDALIALHRVLVKSPKSEAERLRRHECAIAFDWLAGNRERALSAAAVLSQSSPEFKQRWEVIALGLPR